MRIDNIVAIFVRLTVQPTTTNVQYQFALTIPVGRATNFTASSQGGSVGQSGVAGTQSYCGVSDAIAGSQLLFVYNQDATGNASRVNQYILWYTLV